MRFNGDGQDDGTSQFGRIQPQNFLFMLVALVASLRGVVDAIYNSGRRQCLPVSSRFLYEASNPFVVDFQ
jgi:hypothetical protein